jgi:molecular chaperone HtpG
MTTKKLEIHSENILPIIKKWLYSDKDIFVRELVSNSVDAIRKLKILREQGDVQAPDDELRIDVKVDKEKGTLVFSDTGIGMDAEEVQKYIAQIAFSGAEDFLDKYKSNKESDQIIGHFGLGFYSSYMVANKVEINTLSWKPGAEPVLWSCDGSSDYLIEKGTRTTRGTEITLFLDKDNDEYLDTYKIRQILTHYCSFLPYPIYLGDSRINTTEPLWIKPPSECTNNDYLEFYRSLYPMEEEPLFWVHLNVDYPFHLKGILYFPKTQRDMDLNKMTVKLYCNRVFVSDNCKDVIPNYLMALRGVIDSPDIPLNVSRSYLQMDRTVRQLGGHVSKKVTDSLNNLFRNERERFLQSWNDVSIVVKLGILEDEKFYERAKEFLIWKNTEGQWSTLEEYLERNKEKLKDKVLYTRDESHSGHILDIYRQKSLEVLCAGSPIDPYLIQFLERKIQDLKFQRIDGAIEEHILDKEREKTVLDPSGKTEAATLADFVRSKLNKENVDVEAKSLVADSLPGFIIIDEHQRRLRDYMMNLDPSDKQGKFGGFGKQTFVINTNSPLMSAIRKLEDSNPTLAAEMVKQAYDLALLSQREMDPSFLNDFIARSNKVLQHLAEEATKKQA